MVIKGIKCSVSTGSQARCSSSTGPKHALPTTRIVHAAGARSGSAARIHSFQHLQHHQQQRSVVVAAAKPDDEPVIDVEASTVASSSSSGSTRMPSEQDIAQSATAAIDNAASATTSAIDSAATAATSAIDSAATAATAAAADGMDAASALVNDTAAAANTAATDAANIAEAILDAVTGQPAPIDWSKSSGSFPTDDRFNGLKVLVVGATGGVGRCCVQSLQSRGVACRALVRDTARAANLLPQPTSSSSSSSSSGDGPEFDIVTGDVYQYATLPAAFAGCNAVIVCSAANDKTDPFGPFNIDYQGTLNLIAAAKRAGVKRFVFVTSIGADDPFNPLNLFWGILFWKKRAEEELQRSGLTYTIVRPGGLKSRLLSGETAGSIVMEGPNSFGFPPMKRSGAILRSQVADVCVEALVCPAAADKVVEIIAEKNAPERALQQLFEGVTI